MEFSELPYNLDAEQTILGNCIFNPEIISQVKLVLEIEDFYLEKHQHIFDVILSLKVVDAVTVKDKLDTKKIDPKYIFDLAENTTPSAGWKHHAEIIKRDSKKRRLWRLGATLCKEATQTHSDPNEVLLVAKNEVYEIEKDDPVEVVDNEKFYMDLYNDIYSTKTPEMYMGIDCIDSKFYLERGCTTVIAAESGTGKSAFCQQVGDNVAEKYGDTLFFSMESTKQKLGVRRIAYHSNIPLTALNKKDVYDSQSGQLQNAVEELTQSRMFFIDNMIYSVIEKATAYCETYAKKNKLSLVVFDYIQLFESFKKTQNRHLEISGIARKFNVLAKNLNVPVLIVSQLKESDPPNKKPTLNRLKESGDIRNHADNIIFLWSPKPDRTIYDVEFILAKGKDQEKFSTWLEFNGNFQRYTKGQKPLNMSKHRKKLGL